MGSYDTTVSNGAIASGCPHSAQAGADILAAGGNAVDAMVGAALFAAFSLPTMSGLGGGGVATMRIDGELITCDFFAAHPGLGPGLEQWSGGYIRL